MKNERKMKNEINEISCELWMETISRSLTLKKKQRVRFECLFVYQGIQTGYKCPFSYQEI